MSFRERVQSRRTTAFGEAPTTTNFQELAARGIALPHPDAVSEATMATTLWAVIGGLAELGVFLRETDHLSDRELYMVLWKEVLREEVPIQPDGSQGVWQVALPGADPDSRQYLKYYADEEMRRQWRTKFPYYEMPAHVDPPYDRDRHLPMPFNRREPETRH
jgi:hypothetical protein